MNNTINPIIEILEKQALERPKELAVVTNDFKLNFAALYNLVKQVAIRLREAGIKPGDVVVTRLPIGLDWILTLALFHEGTVTHSALVSHPINPDIKGDWLIYLQEGEHGFPKDKVIKIDNSWLSAIKNEESDVKAQVYESPDSPIRFSTTSGTTGKPKVIMTSVSTLISLSKTVADHLPTGSEHLSLAGLPALNGLWGSMSKLIRGETQFQIVPQDGNFLQFFLAHKIQHISGTPSTISDLFNAFDRNPSLTSNVRHVRFFGSMPSKKLIQKLIRDYGLRVTITYGTSEVGLVSVKELEVDSEPGVVGQPLPKVAVRISEPDVNGVGMIEIKPEFEVYGYFNNPEANQKYLRNGWFIPGDIGQILENGDLRILGRADSVVNLGGEKFSLDEIDAMLSGQFGFSDVASFTTDQDENLKIHIAYSAAAEVETREAEDLLLATFPGIRVSGFHHIPLLPRTSTGKIVRRDLPAIIGE